MKNVAVIGDNAGHNWHASLDGKMESTLLEGQQDGVLGVAAGSFRKHVDALALRLNLPGGTGHGIPRIPGVLAIDEDGAAEAHEPAQKGDLLEVRLGRDAAPLGEQGAEHEHVELRLVISDEDSRTGGAEDVFGVVNVKDNARRQGHCVVEGAGGGPLRDALLADEGEDDGGKDAKDGADEQRDVRGQGAGNEAGLGSDEGHHVEEDGDGDVADGDLDGEVDDGHVDEQPLKHK